MSLWEKVAASVLWNLLAAGFFALDYLLAREFFNARPEWAAGFAVTLATVFIVGVPRWGAL